MLGEYKIVAFGYLNSAFKMSFIVPKVPLLVLHHRNIWNEVQLQLFENCKIIYKWRGKYKHGYLKLWKERIKTNFVGQDYPYDMHCNSTKLLKINSIYNQSSIYYSRYMLENINALMQKTSNVAFWVIHMMA